MAKSSKVKNTTDFVEKANLIHNHRYNYSLSNFTKSCIKLTIICKEHGEFLQSPNNHLKGAGCPDCGLKSRASKRSSNTDEFIKKASIVHKGKYSYEFSKYINKTHKVTITCPHHGEFEQRPNDHLNGSGCPECAVTGFDATKPAYLYYLKVTTNEGKELYKIGITNRTIEARFSLTDLQKIEIVKQKLYKIGQDALDWEKFLLKKYNEYQYKGPKVLESGNTELFTEDILGMYYLSANIG